MIWAFAATLLIGAVLAVPLLRTSRDLSESTLDRAEGWLTALACPLLLAVLGWVAFRLYAESYLRVLAGAAALPALIALLLMLRNKSTTQWRRLPQLAGVLGLLAFVPSEAVLASAAAGGLPAQYPNLLTQMAGPRALPGLEASLQRNDPEVRHQAATDLKKFGPAAVPILARALGDSDDNVRALAADAISKAPEKRYLPVLCGLLRDRQETIRSSARLALRTLKDPAAVPALVASFAEQDGFDTTFQYQNLFAEMGSVVRAPLIRALSDRDERIRRTAAASLEQNGNAAVVHALSNSARRDPSARVRAAAVQALGALAAHTRRAEISALLGLHKATFVPTDANAYIDANRVLPILAAATRDVDATVREAAAKGISDLFNVKYNHVDSFAMDPHEQESDLTPLDAKAAIGALVRLLDDPVESIRSQALQGLAMKADRQAVPGLLRVIAKQEQETSEVEYACEGLVWAGDPSVIPALKAADLRVNAEKACPICKALYHLGARSSIRHDVELD